MRQEQVEELCKLKLAGDDSAFENFEAKKIGVADEIFTPAERFMNLWDQIRAIIEEPITDFDAQILLGDTHSRYLIASDKMGWYKINLHVDQNPEVGQYIAAEWKYFYDGDDEPSFVYYQGLSSTLLDTSETPHPNSLNKLSDLESSFLAYESAQKLVGPEPV